MNTIQQLAKDALKYFSQDKRIDGTEFWKTPEYLPSWVHDLIRDSHGTFLPDDHRYAFIVEALNAIADHEGDFIEDIRLDSDIYTHDLLKWVSSHLDRPGYCDEAAAEGFYVAGSPFTDLVSAGQYMEKNEVLGCVLNFLQCRMGETLEEN